MIMNRRLLLVLVLSLFLYGIAGALDPDLTGAAQTAPEVSGNAAGATGLAGSQPDVAPPQPATTLLQLPILSSVQDPSGFFFLAEKSAAEDGADSDTIEFLYRLAFLFARNPAGQEAGRRLLSRYQKQGRIEEAIALAHNWLDSFGADWQVFQTIVELLSASGRHAEALETLKTMQKALATQAAQRKNEFALLEYSVRTAAGDLAWAAAEPPSITSASPDASLARIWRLYASIPGVPADKAALALFRAEAQDKNWARALDAVRPILQDFTRPGTPRSWISELGKTFHGAGAFREGIAFFSAMLGLPESLGDPLKLDAGTVASESQWVASFHLARCYQGAGLSQTAASLFFDLVPCAPSNPDADAALWYWLDITMASIADNPLPVSVLSGTPDAADTAFLSPRRSLEIGALSLAASLWKSPSYFSDIAELYLRRLLRERAYEDVVRYCALMSDRLAASVRGPLYYVSARLIELGLAQGNIGEESPFWRSLLALAGTTPADSADNAEPAPTIDKASIWFRAILGLQGIEEHYRTLASWRLRKDPPLLARVPRLGGSFELSALLRSHLGERADMTPAGAPALEDVLSFIERSLEFGLDSLASAQASSLSQFDTTTLLWLALKFTEHEQYYPALRIGRELLNRSGGVPPEIGYALLYPRAYRDMFPAITGSRGIAEPLAYGIVRSESMFNPKAVSRSGAVGLSQLLPSTASETARGLRMSQYSLTNPSDNLQIGMAYYSYMFERYGKKPVRGMAAYNAGPSRMAQWQKDWGDLPDDILMEMFTIAEPRQYAKNIIAAALHYGRMYYDLEPGVLLDFLLEGRELPSPANLAAGASTSVTP